MFDNKIIMDYLLENKNIRIRKMKDIITDYNLMVKWLTNNELLDYYEGHNHSFDLEKVIKKYSPRTKGEEAVMPCIIEHNKIPIGYIQYYPIEADEYDGNDSINIEKYKLPYAIDMFIGETKNWSKGIGTSALKSLVSYIFENLNADIILIDPHTSNKRAIRCYEKSGFLPMTIIKNREIHDGQYMDSLIMSITHEDWEENNK